MDGADTCSTTARRLELHPQDIQRWALPSVWAWTRGRARHVFECIHTSTCRVTNPSGASIDLGKYQSAHLAAGNHLFAVDKPTWYYLSTFVNCAAMGACRQRSVRKYSLSCTPPCSHGLCYYFCPSPRRLFFHLSSDTAQHEHTTYMFATAPSHPLSQKASSNDLASCPHHVATQKVGVDKAGCVCVCQDLCRLVANTGCFCKSVIAASPTCPLAETCKLFFSRFDKLMITRCTQATTWSN